MNASILSHIYVVKRNLIAEIILAAVLLGLLVYFLSTPYSLTTFALTVFVTLFFHVKLLVFYFLRNPGSKMALEKQVKALRRFILSMEYILIFMGIIWTAICVVTTLGSPYIDMVLLLPLLGVVSYYLTSCYISLLYRKSYYALRDLIKTI